MLVDFIDSLGINQVDLVGNDSGGGICQIFAALNPRRIRSLTLTNCDTHDGWPPEAFKPTVELAFNGTLPSVLQALANDPKIARSAFAIGFEHPENVSDAMLRGFFEPLVSSQARIQAVTEVLRKMDCKQSVAIEPELRKLEAPALIVWGNADPFFEMKWAYWLRDALPGTRRLVELQGAKLFLPLDRPGELAVELLVHWQHDQLVPRLSGSN